MPVNEQIHNWIGDVEKKWLDRLHQYAKDLFSRVFLPSHDHTHHLRVWNISKNLMHQIASQNTYLNPSFVEAMMIAVYFHDLGMVVNRKKEHGRISRTICAEYFSKNFIERPGRFDEILEAIEMHDRKGEKIYHEIPINSPPKLFSLLSIADDLDAMGVIGIYRYAEVYLHRGIDLNTLGTKILGNVSMRFENITKTCRLFPGIIVNIRHGFAEIVSFYDKFNQQLLLESVPEKVFSGQLGVINYIRNLSVQDKIRPEDYLKEIKKSAHTVMVTDYFDRLKNALEKHLD